MKIMERVYVYPIKDMESGERGRNFGRWLMDNYKMSAEYFGDNISREEKKTIYQKYDKWLVGMTRDKIGGANDRF